MSHRLLLLLSVCVVLGGDAFDGKTPVVKNLAKAVTWSGTVTRGAAIAGAPAICADGCARFDISVDLPASTWDQHPGGVQVAIRWQSQTLGDNLLLYVYRDGQLLASSAGIIATAQSVLLPSLPNGPLQIYVAFDPTSLNDAVAYDGLVEIERAPRANPLRLLTPDLEPRAQRNLGFDPGGIFFDTISEHYPTCYDSEVAEGARLCLRFDQIFANVGDGPLELRFAVPAGTFPATTNAVQRRYWSDSAVAPQDDSVGPVEFHDVHAHYHFNSFGLSRLWSVDAGQKKLKMLRSRTHKRMFENRSPRTGRKVSFCLADIEIDAWAKKGDGPRTFNAPDCLFPAESTPTSDQFVQGITQGWADVYDWYLPDQYMDVSHLEDGEYFLETVADPDNLVREADESNNCSGILIRLSGLDTSTPAATVLSESSRCQR